VHAVLGVGAADRRRPLRAQRHRAAARVLEGEHLLADDVGRLADAAGEEPGVLEGRGLDPPVAGAAEELARVGDHPLASLLLLGEDVEGAAGRLEAGGHRARP
jgi:hypothetical protein